MQYWYVVLNGTKLPTPYESFQEAREAGDELRERLVAPIIDYVLE